jgi:hypothetical protein
MGIAAAPGRSSGEGLLLSVSLPLHLLLRLGLCDVSFGRIVREWHRAFVV